MKLADVLHKECIAVNAQPGDKAEALLQVTGLAKKSSILENVSEQEILVGLQARESLSSTGVGKGIAIPHCRLKTVKDFVMGIVTVPAGNVVGERWLDDVAQSFNVHWTDTARIKDNRFIEIRKVSHEPRQYSARLVDMVTGKETPFEHYPGGYAASVSRFADGGFVLLDTYSQRYSPGRADLPGCRSKQLWQNPAPTPPPRSPGSTG